MAKLFLKKIPSVPKLKPLGDAVRKAQWESMLGVGEGRERKMCVAFGFQEGTPVSKVQHIHDFLHHIGGCRQDRIVDDKHGMIL